MKKILFVVDEKKMGGVSVLLETILEHLKNYKIDVLVLHNNGDMFKNISQNINIIYGTPYFSAIDYTIKDALKSKNLILILRKVRTILDMKTGLIKTKIKKERKKIIKEHYDVEIAFKDGFTALFTAYGNTRKKVHWLHYEYGNINLNSKYDKLFFDALPRFNQIIAVSEKVKQGFNSIYHLEEKTSVINNIVDTNKIRQKSLEFNDIKDKNKLNFISVGRIHEHKGYDRLIEAIKRLNSENLTTNVHFKIYGDGPLSSKLNDIIISNKLENIISLEGRVDNPYPYIKNSDLFILPSLYESFGLVVVEALILGVPVLATNVAATNELIKNNETGLIVENSTNGIYLGLKNIIINSQKLETFKNNLTEYHYKISDIISKIENVLNN